jgi:hypothetical protein
MATAKTGFATLPVAQKIVKARFYVTQLTNNANFTTPDPSIKTIGDAATTLEIAHNDTLDGSKTKAAIAKTAEAALDAIIVLFAAYVQFISKGDETIIRSSGLEVKESKTPPQPLPMVIGLIIETGINEGEITLSWDKIANSKVYKIESSADGNTNWQYISESTKTSITLTNQPTATKIWLRVAAFGAKGQGPWSDPAKGLVR